MRAGSIACRLATAPPDVEVGKPVLPADGPPPEDDEQDVSTTIGHANAAMSTNDRFCIGPIDRGDF
jgi:hypothetical protein